MPILEARYISQGLTLKLSADLDRGWVRHKKSFCFSKQIVCDWKLDYKLRITLSVFPRPSGLHDEASRVSDIHAETVETQGVRYAVTAAQLDCEVPLLVATPGVDMRGFPPGVSLNPELPWGFTETKKLRVHVLRNIASAVPQRNFELQLLVVFDPPPRAVPTYRDWERHFCPGGLPSLGKRQ